VEELERLQQENRLMEQKVRAEGSPGAPAAGSLLLQWLLMLCLLLQ
jgi:hypothetical protein